MKQQYIKPQVNVFSHDLKATQQGLTNPQPSLGYKDILGLVQDAFAEIGGDFPTVIEIKRQVLNHVSENKLTLALHTAIVGASKVHNSASINLMETTGLGKVQGIEGDRGDLCACMPAARSEQMHQMSEPGAGA